MKRIISVLLSASILMACSSTKPVPTYKIEQEVMDSLAKSDTTASVVIYNVIVPEEKKKGISDETLRMLIAEFFSTMSAIFAIFKVEENATP